jgi:hypothetical protein
LSSLGDDPDSSRSGLATVYKHSMNGDIISAGDYSLPNFLCPTNSSRLSTTTFFPIFS